MARAIGRMIKQPVRTSSGRSPLPPSFIEPHAKLVETAPTRPQWVHQIKFDGFRMAARIEAGKVRLLARSGLDWTAKYPETAAAPPKLPVDSAYVDGELCAVRDDGVTSFALESRLEVLWRARLSAAWNSHAGSSSRMDMEQVQETHFSAIILVCATSAAMAQNARPPANQDPSTPAISYIDRNNPGAPAAGANSFTEGHPKSRIEPAGYSNVTGLAKDMNCLWRGMLCAAPSPPKWP